MIQSMKLVSHRYKQNKKFKLASMKMHKIFLNYTFNKKCLKPIIVVNNAIKEASQNFLKLDPYKILKSKKIYKFGGQNLIV